MGSALIDGTLNEGRLIFRKKYLKPAAEITAKGEILYHLVKQNKNTWIGSFTLQSDRSGKIECSIMPAHDNAYGIATGPINVSLSEIYP